MYDERIKHLDFLRGIKEEEANVKGLNETANGVDGDEKHSIGLEECIVYPKHRTEQSNHIRN